MKSRVSPAAAVRRSRHTPTFGAVPAADGVRFRVWAPDARTVDLHLVTGTRALAEAEDGTWEIAADDVRPGDRYAYSVDGGPLMPDPASRFQPGGVHDWSEVVDPSAFRWTDDRWSGLDPRRVVLYELHVGTFTPEGTFAAAAAKLPYLQELGVTAIELMPLADFAGRRNWGYDGVALFAPSRAYGRPDDLRQFVDDAHRTGLAVIVDVVYNHLGPDGAYLPAFSSRFFTRKHPTPWGPAVNLDDAGSAHVRRLLTENALHWIHEYHADGLRLDATHALLDGSDRHFVADLAAAVHDAADPCPLVYAEDHRNLSLLVEEPSRGGWGLDGVWADDFHHIVRRMLAGDSHGYYADFAGDAGELAATLRGGWLFTGQHSRVHDAPRGSDPSSVPMRKSVVCIQNHDQVGNRAMGDRLHHAADPAAWRAAVTVLLTAPMTPLLFMGQEWSASTPFLFFTDFDRTLGQQVVVGRRREFAAFPEFAAPGATERIPDPQADATFAASTLRWEERHELNHGGVLALHRALLGLRRDLPALQASDAPLTAADAIDRDTVAFRRDEPGSAPVIVVARLRGRGRCTVEALKTGTWQLLLDTEQAAYAPDPAPLGIDPSAGTVEFERPGAIVLAEMR
jgi:maltooligosyltrehalose trehalohydrolase